MSDAAVDRRASVERRLDGGLLAVGLVSLVRSPTGRAAGDKAAEQDDQGDRDELDAETR
jgi:hypothetical protein